MSKIDLHIHSKYSDDGEFTPHEIVKQCRKEGVGLTAITDHNSVRGVPEALAAAAGAATGMAVRAETEPEQLRVIPGVELDCTYGGKNFHLLGYGFDYTREEFAIIEQDILTQERNAAKEKIRLFCRSTGIPVNVTAVLAAADNGVVPGELIAEIVLAQRDAGQYEALRPYLPGGEKSDMPNVRFYWDFFSAGKPAYVPIRYLTLRDAAALIHSAGGIAVLAHPGQNLAGDNSLLTGIISEGIDGIEAFSSYHSKSAMAYYLAAAEENGLLVTCGSDFHGKYKPKITLGGHGAIWDDRDLMAGVEKRLAETFWHSEYKNTPV